MLAYAELDPKKLGGMNEDHFSVEVVLNVEVRTMYIFDTVSTSRVKPRLSTVRPRHNSYVVFDITGLNIRV